MTTDLSTLIQTAKQGAREALERITAESEQATVAAAQLKSDLINTVREAVTVLDPKDVAEIIGVSQRQVSVWLSEEKDKPESELPDPDGSNELPVPTPEPVGRADVDATGVPTNVEEAREDLERRVKKAKAKPAPAASSTRIQLPGDEDMPGTGEELVGS